MNKGKGQRRKGKEFSVFSVVGGYDVFSRLTTYLSKPLRLHSRILVLIAALSLLPTFFVPLWRMTFFAQQYPEGLNLYIFSHALKGGNEGNDLREINILNHYIGMAELREEDFSELKWIPLIIGLIAVLTLRAAVIGTQGSILDVIVMSIYFALFSLWSFYHKMYFYGHYLDPRASVHVAPFTPPVFGYKLVGQFHVWSYPSTGAYIFLLFGVLLIASLILSQWFPSQGGVRGE